MLYVGALFMWFFKIGTGQKLATLIGMAQSPTFTRYFATARPVFSVTETKGSTQPVVQPATQ